MPSRSRYADDLVCTDAAGPLSAVHINVREGSLQLCDQRLFRWWLRSGAGACRCMRLPGCPGQEAAEGHLHLRMHPSLYFDGGITLKPSRSMQLASTGLKQEKRPLRHLKAAGAHLEAFTGHACS